MTRHGPSVESIQVLESLRALLVCPACHGTLGWSAQTIVCSSCSVPYRVEDGIPVLVASSADVDHDEIDHEHAAGDHNAGQAAWFDRASAEEFEITRPRGTPALYEWFLLQKADRALRPIGSELRGAIAVVACGGSGMDADFLAARGAQVISTDISLGAARRARERARRYELPILSVVAAAEGLPLSDRAVDLSYVHDGLHHLEDPLPALDELARVASRWVSVSEPAKALATQIAVRAGLALEREEAGNVVRRMTPAETMGRFQISGFHPLRSERYAMYYRHEPGRVTRLLSRPALLPLVKAGWRAANFVLGRIGNKLVVVGRRAS
jgi:SAM-dependent methyltransferase